MSIAFDHFCLMVSFKIPNAVELSVGRGVGGFVWPSSVSLTPSGAPLWALRKHSPTSESAVEATTFLMTKATLRIESFSLSCSWELLPKKETELRVGFVRWKRKGMRCRCGCAITCHRRDI
jgi:hypothetical protein